MTKKDFNIKVEDLNTAGAFFGHRISRCHPKMKPFVLGIKGSDHINIIDLEKTKEYLIKALDYFVELTKEEETILFVGTKVAAKELVKEIANNVGQPYVNERWIGGTLTNFDIIKKRVEYLKDLEKKKETGELEKYTKKERLEIDKTIERLKLKFEGIKTLEKKPDVLFIIDLRKDDLAVREAHATGLPIIALSDTNVDPTTVDYPIPANDDAKSSVRYILDKIQEVILDNKK